MVGGTRAALKRCESQRGVPGMLALTVIGLLFFAMALARLRKSLAS